MRRAPFLLLSLFALAAAAVPLARGATAEHDYARHAVAADNAEASQAGLEILKQGGTAADAAAATMLALGVASPSGSGLGGGGFALYYEAKTKTLTFLDFRETAPAAASADMFERREDDDEETAADRSRHGGLAVGVPGEAAGVAELVKRFGKLPLKDVVQPARRLAEEGFGLTEHSAKMLGYMWPLVSKDPVVKGWPQELTAGTQLKNPALAKTLARLGSQGRRGFYQGPVARALVTETRKRGGVLTLADLKAYEVKEREPVVGEALGYRFVSSPPPSAGGYTVVQSLQLVDRWTAGDADMPRAARWHALAESFKGAYLDRERYFGDPDHADMPLDALSETGRLEERASRFRPQLAQPAEAYAVPLPDAPVEPAVHPDNAGTSHLCVVDGEGNIASVTTTVNLAFGAGFSAAGLWLNDEMDDFARQVGKDNAFGLVGGAPNLPGPGKRPISSMSPTIVMKDDAPVLCVGASGGSRIITAVAQVALYVLRGGLHPDQAVAAPRIHHQAHPSSLQVRGLTEEDLAGLRARGHEIENMRYSASVQAIAIDRDAERPLRAASDPSKGGEPAGE